MGCATSMRLIAVAQQSLTSGGMLVFEIGLGQAADVTRAIDDAPALELIDILPDLQGIARTVVARRSGRRGLRPRGAGYTRAMSCLFCKIIAGEIPSKRIYEDADLIAFEDINPQAPLHCLVVPRRHIATLNELEPGDDSLVGAMARAAAAIAQRARRRSVGLSHGVQLQQRRGADRLPHSPARAWRPPTRMAARVKSGFEVSRFLGFSVPRSWVSGFSGSTRRKTVTRVSS